MPVWRREPRCLQQQYSVDVHCEWKQSPSKLPMERLFNTIIIEAAHHAFLFRIKQYCSTLPLSDQECPVGVLNIFEFFKLLSSTSQRSLQIMELYGRITKPICKCRHVVTSKFRCGAALERNCWGTAQKVWSKTLWVNHVELERRARSW